MSKPGIRVAGLTRVSTERQEQQGESLSTQRKQIERAAKSLGGKIVRWYEGAEHATEGHERRRFDQMLRDAAHGLFDALVVADASRLTRDPASNVRLIQVFGAHNVRLFVLEREHNLFDPRDKFFLRMLADVHAFAAEENVAKSRDNRIELAKKGYPSSGTLPFGRRYDRDRKAWTIDAAAKKLLEGVARKVLRGHSLELIAKEFNESGEVDLVSGGPYQANTLRRRLVNAGSRYVQKFRHNGSIVEVASTIPALLPGEVVARVRRQLRESKIIAKRGRVYPLAHAVRCEACGSVLSGAGTTDYSYYRHHSTRIRGKACVSHVPAESLETAVLAQLGALLKEDKTLEANIRQAVKKLAGEDDESKIPALEAREKKLVKEIEALVERLAEEGLPAWEQSIKAAAEKREAALSSVRSRLSQERARRGRTIPADLGNRVRAIIGDLTGHNGYRVLSWNPEAQQRLALYFVGGAVIRDPRRGIWVKRDAALEKEFGGRVWTYRIEGDLAVGTGAVTLTSKGKKAAIPAIDDALSEQELRSELDGDTLASLASRVADARSLKLRSRRWSASECRGKVPHRRLRGAARRAGEQRIPRVRARQA